jgi:hypothetical protein
MAKNKFIVEKARIRPTKAPTNGPPIIPPTIAGICIVVADPERFGTGINPIGVTLRMIEIAPNTPANTIFFV